MGRSLGVPLHEAAHKSAGLDAFLSTDVLEAIAKRWQETSGPTTLAAGSISDGQYLKRSGTTIVSGSPVATTTQILTTSPLTGGGDLSSSRTITFVSESGNIVLASPSGGGAGVPDFRALVSADIPSLAASKITSGQLAATQGGTGAGTTTAGDLLVGAGGNTWSKLAVGANTYVLTSDGTTASWAAAGGGGAGSLAATLAVGNTTGSNNIVVSSGQKITGADGSSSGVTLNLEGGDRTGGGNTNGGGVNITAKPGAGDTGVPGSVVISTSGDVGPSQGFIRLSPGGAGGFVYGPVGAVLNVSGAKASNSTATGNALNLSGSAGGSTSGDGGYLQAYAGSCTSGTGGFAALGGGSGGGSNKAAGGLVLNSGASTGNKPGHVEVYRSVSGASGSGSNGGSHCFYGSGLRKALTNTVATTFALLSTTTGSAIGCTVVFTVRATDGTDFQVFSGQFSASAVNKAGTTTVDASAVGSTSSKSTSGALTVTSGAVASGTDMALQVTATSSVITATTYDICYTILPCGDTTVTPQ